MPVGREQGRPQAGKRVPPAPDFPLAIPSCAPMRLGLILYGNLTMQSGGFLYDRLLVEHLRRRGHEVQEISLPWRHYA